MDFMINKLIGRIKGLRGDSVNWGNWQSTLAINACAFCVKQHGKIVEFSVLLKSTSVLAHPFCYCIYVPMRTKKAGTATDMGVSGPDVALMYFGTLPDYYITKSAAEDAGWNKKQGNLASVLPGGVIGGDIYRNDDLKLPQVDGRIWYEADINYNGGFRGQERILYSSDGLIFVSYDHYNTFYEITR